MKDALTKAVENIIAEKAKKVALAECGCQTEKLFKLEDAINNIYDRLHNVECSFRNYNCSLTRLSERIKSLEADNEFNNADTKVVEKVVPVRSGEFWPEYEDASLQTEFINAMQEIANKHERTIGGIRERIKRNDLINCLYDFC